jgi:hypothetical protein
MKGSNHYYMFILFLILYIVYYFQEEETDEIEFDLEKDGIHILHKPMYSSTIDRPCYELEKDVFEKLPDYVFLDYVYKINNTSLSTFHRDVTSSQKIFNTKHPIYTLILYKYSGELLSLCPGSHHTYPFVWSRIVNVTGDSGTAFLFNSDVLHAGRTNQCKERKVIQYKLCHKEDVEKLKNLQGIFIEKTEECKDDVWTSIKRKISYYLEMPINSIAYPLMIKRENKNSFVGKLQSLIPLQFYNNY